MPYLDIRIANTALDQPARHQLGQRGTALLRDLLGKRPELTAVSIIDLPSSSWMIGTQPQSDSGRPAAHAEVTVTSGTNTAEQKARFIAGMAALLRETLPALHQATYVVVREIDARSWGYDGLTQDDRKQASPGVRASVGAIQQMESLGGEPQIKRSASGAIDTEFYMAQARRARRDASYSALKQVVAAVAQLPDVIKAAFQGAKWRPHG